MVRVPFLSMVNLVAGREVVPELMQSSLTGENLAEHAGRLLRDEAALSAMREGLTEVRNKLSVANDPMGNAVTIIESVLEKETVNVL
jgi:lipid-A-disaccharide synthase